MKELTNTELKNINGGGWLAEAIARWKCGCANERGGRTTEQRGRGLLS